MDKDDVDEHIKRLMKLGFSCRAGDAGLSLIPVAGIESADVICPACELPSGNDEICRQCGVIIHKYLKQKEFDDQLKIQLKASQFSEEQMWASRSVKTK